MKNLSLIVAMTPEGVIGRDGQIPWKIAEDMAYFRNYTMGKTVIMGRKTAESIPDFPLKGRENWVLSYKGCTFPGAKVYTTKEDLYLDMEAGKEYVVIGGAEIYKDFLPYCETLLVTEIKKTVEGNVFFPHIEPDEWQREEVSEEKYDAETDMTYQFVRYIRKIY